MLAPPARFEPCGTESAYGCYTCLPMFLSAHGGTHAACQAPRVGLWLLLGCGGVALARPVNAQKQADLSWVRLGGADSCPDPQRVRKQVNAELRRDAFAAREGRADTLFIEGLVRSDESGFRATIYARNADGALVGTRELRHPTSCASLLEATALVIALLIDPAARPSRPSSDPSPGRAASPEPPASPPEQGARQASASTTRGLRLGAAVALGRGLLPGTAIGFELGGGTRLGRWLRWDAAVSYWPETRTQQVPTDFAFGLTAGSLRLCASGSAAGLALSGSLCAGVHVGALHAVVFEAWRPTRPGDRAWIAASLGLLGAFKPWTAPLAVELGIRALAPITRQRFMIGEQEILVFQQSQVALGTSAGLSLNFD